MARDRKKYVTLYSPTGTEVEVNESRGEVLKSRGYTTSKPRNPAGRRSQASKADNSAELQAEVDRLKAENEKLKASQTPAQTGQ